jgi:hypothetical protein
MILLKILRDNYILKYNELHALKIQICNSNQSPDKEHRLFEINKKLSATASLISNIDVIIDTGCYERIAQLNIETGHIKSIFEANKYLKNWNINHFGQAFGSMRAHELYYSYHSAETIDELRVWFCSLTEAEIKTLTFLINGSLYYGLESRINGEGVEL